MIKYKIISEGKVLNKTYVDANSVEDAIKEVKAGNGYGYEEIDYYSEEIKSIEEV